MHSVRLAVFLLCALIGAAVFAAEKNMAPGCRLDPNDPLRAEIDEMMRQGAAYEEAQRLALEDKVTQLGRNRGWSKSQEHEYLQRLLAEGLRGSWDQTLAVAAAFIQVCEEQSDGNQRADAVRLFREFYVVEARQWRSMHEAIDRELSQSPADEAAR